MFSREKYMKPLIFLIIIASILTACSNQQESRPTMESEKERILAEVNAVQNSSDDDLIKSIKNNKDAHIVVDSSFETCLLAQDMLKNSSSKSIEVKKNDKYSEVIFCKQDKVILIKCDDITKVNTRTESSNTEGC